MDRPAGPLPAAGLAGLEQHPGERVTQVPRRDAHTREHDARERRTPSPRGVVADAQLAAGAVPGERAARPARQPEAAAGAVVAAADLLEGLEQALGVEGLQR